MSDSVILLDIDGTLIDSTYHHAFAWHRAFLHHDLDVPMWRLHRTIGMGGDKLVGEVAGDRVEDELGDRLRDRWKEEYAAVLGEVRPLAGAAELVRDLRGRGHRVVLASSGAREFSEQAVELLGIGDDIDAMTSSEDAEDSKPEADILAVALGEVPAERAVVVGDTPYDVEAATRLGLRCLTQLSGGYSRAELVEAGAAEVVDVPADLVGLDWEPWLRHPR